MSVLVVTLAILVCMIAALGFQRFSKHMMRVRIIEAKGCRPPPSLPQRDPVLGLDIIAAMFRSMDGRRNISLKEQLERYGNTFSARLYGQTRYFTIEPRNLQSVFSTDVGSWGVAPLRRFVFEPLIGHGVMNSDGAAWEVARAMLRQSFTKAQLIAPDALERHVGRLLELIAHSSGKAGDGEFGETIDLQPLFVRQALDVSTEFLFGTSTNTLSDAPSISAKTFLDAYNYALRGIGKRMHLPFFNIFTRDGKFWRSCETVKRQVDLFIKEQKNLQLRAGESNQDQLMSGCQGPARLILIRELLRQNLDHVVVRDQLLNVFLPAHDADAIGLTNVFFALARHPQVYNKLRTEVLANCATAKDIGSIDKLKSLPYLQSVLRETMRLYPSIGTTSRIALRDTILPTGGGSDGAAPILICKGDVLSTSLYALHRRKDIWGPDANEFNPERWDELVGETAKAGRAHWSFLPFLAGPRVCPGQNFATAEILYTVVRIVQSFSEIENRDPVLHFVESYKITTESKNGAKVAFKR